MGRPVIPNQLNLVTRFVYDAAMWKIAETNANTEVTKFTYNGLGNLLTLTDGKANTTSWVYDQFGRAIDKYDATNTLLFIYEVYDAAGVTDQSLQQCQGGDGL